jgi:hypothetical protein
MKILRRIVIPVGRILIKNEKRRFSRCKTFDQCEKSSSVVYTFFVFL